MTLTALALAASLAVQIPPNMKEVQLCFFTDGPSAGALAPAELPKLQQLHLKNLQSLWESRKALLVGPITDGKGLRGIVVMDVGSEEKAKSILMDDPYVKTGEMSVATYSWLCDPSYFLKGPKFLDVKPYWIGLLRRTTKAVGPESGENPSQGHMDNINKMAAEGALLSAGPIMKNQKTRGVFIFKDMPEAEIRALTQRDPLIRDGILTLNLYRWHTADGSFKLTEGGK